MAGPKFGISQHIAWPVFALTVILTSITMSSFTLTQVVSRPEHIIDASLHGKRFMTHNGANQAR